MTTTTTTRWVFTDLTENPPHQDYLTLDQVIVQLDGILRNLDQDDIATRIAIEWAIGSLRCGETGLASVHLAAAGIILAAAATDAEVV